MNAIWIVLPILMLLMFELGLTLDTRGFARFAQRPAPVIAGLVGQILLLPLLAFGLGQLFGLEPVLLLGLMLIACSPGGSSSNIFSMVAKGDVPLSILLTSLSSIVTLFTIPVIMRLAVHWAGSESGTVIELPVGSLIVQNLLLVLTPVVIGAIVRWRKPLLSERLNAILSKVTIPALIILVCIFFAQHHTTIAAHIGRLGLCIVSLILLAMAGGWLLGRVMGATRIEGRTLVIEVGMQNAAQAIAIATSPFIFANDQMAVPAIIYALLMNLILLAYIGIVKRRA